MHTISLYRAASREELDSWIRELKSFVRSLDQGFRKGGPMAFDIVPMADDAAERPLFALVVASSEAELGASGLEGLFEDLEAQGSQNVAAYLDGVPDSEGAGQIKGVLCERDVHVWPLCSSLGTIKLGVAVGLSKEKVVGQYWATRSGMAPSGCSRSMASTCTS